MSSIEHQPQQHRFIVEKEGEEAILEYVLSGSDIDFTRTFVPPGLRGGGVARQLVDQGLEWANKQDYEISASCSYVAKVLQRNKG